MAAVEGEACCAVEEAAADIICSLRGADLAGWTPPWRAAPTATGACEGSAKGEEKEWPVVARGKRSRSRRRSPSTGSGSAARKGRWARGSPASPLDYSGSGASTSGGEDGAFCSPPATAAAHAAPTTTTTPAASTKVVPAARRPLILPAPPPPRAAGLRPRKKMRLPEIQQLVQSLALENDGLREEMEALQSACAALSKENCKLETRLEQKSKRNGIKSEGIERRPQHATEQDTQNGFVLPDLNLPVQDVADGSAP